mmetsp:Transcript_102448/g.260161  ORF Transcript_102448/g.260161 Transcript_102448/m.260161 type:complete len:258 (-) Transcript_102448:53-826(-)
MLRALPRLFASGISGAAASRRTPRLALIHAMQPSIGSSLPAFEQLWPEAELVHIMDDSLARDVARTGIDESMTNRFLALGRYAKEAAGCSGILFTCSAFGSAIEAVQAELRRPGFPVLKPNEALMEEASGLAKSMQAPVAVFSMFEPTLASIVREMHDIGGSDVDVRPHFVPGALDALNAGKNDCCIGIIAEYVAQVVSDAREENEDFACVVFAMFSMARARAATQERLDISSIESAPPVLTSPDSAVLRMKALMGH